MQDAIVIAQTGKTVNLREQPKKSARVLEQIPVGTVVQVICEAGAEWYQLDYKGRVGYMMREFLVLKPEEDEEPEIPDEPVDVEDRIAALEKRMQRIEDAFGEKIGWG